jgi:hypothetical protein
MKEYGKMDENTVKILEDAFSVGASDIEACFLANISKQTLYNYQKKNPSFVDRKMALKDMPKYAAKKVVVKAIEAGDKQQANWYLERKDKEFKNKQDITTDDKPLPILGYAISNYNSNNQDNEDEEENKSDSRGDISIKDNIDSPLLDTLIPERPKENSN